MPDAAGNIKGSGWTRKQAEGWERAFGSKTDLSGFEMVMTALDPDRLLPPIDEPEPPMGSPRARWPQRYEAQAGGCTCEWYGVGSILEFDPACPILNQHKPRTP